MADIYYRHAHRSQEELDILKKKYELFDTADIPRIFQKSLHLTALSWKKSESYGTSHVVYYVNVKEHDIRYVLRANIGVKIPELSLLVEQMITDHVRNLGIPVNRILTVDVARNYFNFDYQIQEALPGKDIESSFDGTKEEYDRISFQLGTFIAKWQEITFPKFGFFDESKVASGVLDGTKNTFYEYVTVKLTDDLTFLSEANLLTSVQAAQVIKLFEEYKPIMLPERGCVVHHDIADHNIMYDNHTITGVFDWENAVSGDPVLDLASCPTWKTYYPREEKLIEGYRSLRSLPEHFSEKMNIYRLRTIVWKTVFNVRFGILTPDRLKRFHHCLSPFGISI